MATRNRLTHLQITLNRLINSLKSDEEIIVIDGNSTDGSKEYLQQLFELGEIHQFISEPDHNQAHAWNKGLLLAKGVLIKKIIDDDVYCYTAIDRCKQLMLSNPDVDICISDCLTTSIEQPTHISTGGRLKYYEAWRSGQTTCFTFSDVHMLIKRRALSYLGLYDTQFTMIDWEYSLRCSYLKANIVYYTGANALAVSTPGNVTSLTNRATLKKEALIGCTKYGYEGDNSDLSLYSKIKIGIGRVINYKGKKIAASSAEGANMPLLTTKTEIYEYLYNALDDYNSTETFRFILG
jgi:glycosyltransferase involved in cell wall biosynthesis